MDPWTDPRFVRLQRPEDLHNLDGLTRAEYEAQQLYGVEPPPIPEPTPFHPIVTRLIIATIGVLSGTCAWFTDSWIRTTGIAFAVLFLCLAILPARRRRR